MNTHVTEDDLMEDVFSINRSPSSYRFSQRSLRSLSTSPKKRMPRPGRTPDHVDESSVDIYGDLSMDSIQIEPDDADKKKPVEMDTDMKKNMDLYTDVLVSDLSEKEKLQRRIKELEDQNQTLSSQNQVLLKGKAQLSKNISSLFMTAKSELQQKDQEINRLRKVIDDLQATETTQKSKSGVSTQMVNPKPFLHENTRGDKQEREDMSKCSIESTQSTRQSQRDEEQRQRSKRDRSHLDTSSDRSRHQCGESDRFLADSKRDSRKRHGSEDRDRSRSPIGSETNFDKGKRRVMSTSRVESRNVAANKTSKDRERSPVQLKFVAESNGKPEKKSDKEREKEVPRVEENGRRRYTIPKIKKQSERLSVDDKSSSHHSSVLEKSSPYSAYDSDKSSYRTPSADKTSDENNAMDELNSEQRDISMKEKLDLNPDKTIARENSDKYKRRDFRKEKDIVEAHKWRNRTEKQNSPQKFDLRSKLLLRRKSAAEKDNNKSRTEKSSGNTLKGKISEREVNKKDGDKETKRDIGGKSQKEIPERNDKQLIENFHKSQEAVGSVGERQAVRFDLETGVMDVTHSQKDSAGRVQKNLGGVKKKEYIKPPIVNSDIRCELEKSGGEKNSNEKSHVEEKGHKSELNRRMSINKKENPSRSYLSSSVTESVEHVQRDGYDSAKCNFEISDIQHKKSNDDNAGKLEDRKASKRGSSPSENLDFIGNQSSCDKIDPKQTESAFCGVSASEEELKKMQKITDRNNSHTKYKKEYYLGNCKSKNSLSAKPISSPKFSDPATSHKVRTGQLNKMSSPSSFEGEDNGGQCMEIESEESEGEQKYNILRQDKTSHHTGLLDNPSSTTSHQTVCKRFAAVDIIHKSAPSDSTVAKVSQNLRAETQHSLMKNITESGELMLFKTLSCRSFSDKSLDSEIALDVSKGASLHKEKSAVSGFCHANGLGTHNDADDCFASYKEISDSSSQPTSEEIDSHFSIQQTRQQREGSDLYPITTQCQALTSVSMSNQDVGSMASNGSLPFSHSMDNSKTSDLHQEKSSSQPLSPSNHTWPFKVADPSHGSLLKKPESTLTLSSSSSSSSSTSCHLQKAHHELSQIHQHKRSSKSSDLESVRAFPITNLQSDDVHRLSQPKLPTVIISSAEGNDVDTLNANPVSTESSSEKSSNSQEIEGSSVASTEANSRPDNDTDTNSTSAERQRSTERKDFQSLICEPSSVDDANLSPPKMWRRNLHTTPSKSNLSPSLFSPQRRKSSNVMCTPNLIVLGDEETSSVSLISPCKPNLIPSDFYPPGVRMNPQEVSTHRHIRGEPELLHDGANVHFEQTHGTKGYERDSTDSDVKADRRGEDITSESTSNETIQTVTEDGESKDSEDVRKDITNEKRSSSQETSCEGHPVGKSTSEKESSSSECQGTMQSVMQNAFERVFKKNYSTFKTEMVEKADIDHLLLRTTLIQAVQSIRKQKPRTRLSKRIAIGCQGLQNSAQDTDRMDDVSGKKISDRKDSKRSTKKSESKLSNKPDSKLTSCDSETIHGNDLDQNSNNVNVNYQKMEVSAEAGVFESSSMCFKCQSATCVCNKSKFDWHSGVTLPSESTSEDKYCSDICLQSSGSQSHGGFASSCKRKVFKFSFFTPNSAKSSDVPSSKKHGLEKHSGSVMTCREESTQSSVLSISKVNEDKMIHEMVSSLGTNWQEAIDKDFREQVNLNQPLFTTAPVDLPQDLTMPNITVPSTNEISFAGRIPSLLNDENDDDEVFKVIESVDMQTNSVPRGQKRKDSRDEVMPTLCGHKNDKVRPDQKQSIKGGYCASPDTCAVTSSDLHREDTATAGTSITRISPFGAEEPDSTCDIFPKCIGVENIDCHSSKKKKEAEVSSVKIKSAASQNLIYKSEVEKEDRPDLPDSPQKDFRMRRDRDGKTVNTPKTSRRGKLNARGKGKKTLPLGNLTSLNRRLFPNDDSDESSESLGKLQMNCGKAIGTKEVTSLKTKCSEYDRGFSMQREEEGKEDSPETIENSESYDSTLEDNDRFLNTTFTVCEQSSEGEEKDVTLTQKSHERNLSNSSGNSTPFGSPDYSSFVEKRKRFISTPQRAWTFDELSLDAQSLSEFDQDVMKAKQSMVLNRINSRTASFSSLLSVGHDSPMSVSSQRFSTPTGQRSPRDALLSPCEGRALDSCDEGVLELDDEVADDLGSVEGHQKHGEKGECLKNSNPVKEKLSRHLAFQELQKMMLVKKCASAYSSSGILNRNEETHKPTEHKSQSVREISDKGNQCLFKHEKAPSVHSSLGRSHKPKDRSVSEDHKQKCGDLLEEKNTHYQEGPQSRKVLDSFRSAGQKLSNRDSEHSSHDQTTANLHPLESSETEISKTDVFESPIKTFKSRKDIGKQPEDSLSSEEGDSEGDVCFHDVENDALKRSGSSSTVKCKESVSRKSVNIVELSPMEFITAGSPSSQDENHFILKRLQQSPTKPVSKTKSSPLSQVEARAPACRNMPKEPLAKPKETLAPSNPSGNKQQPRLSDCVRRERSSQSPLRRTSHIPEVDQEVLSWARAHQKNVDRVKLKLNSRLTDDSEDSADDADEQGATDEIEHQKVCVMSVTEPYVSDEYVFQAVESSGEMSESVGSEEEERGGSCEDYEDGEIPDDSDNDEGGGISDGSSKTSQFINCNEQSSLLSTGANKSLSQQGCRSLRLEEKSIGRSEIWSSKHRSSDKCGRINPDKNEPRETGLNFVQKSARSNSEPRHSPLAEAYPSSPSKNYGNVLDGARSSKRRRSPSPDCQLSGNRSHKPKARRESFDLRIKLSSVRSKQDIDHDGRRFEKRRRDSFSKEEGKESIKSKSREEGPSRTERYGSSRNSAERANPQRRSQRQESPDNRHDVVHRRDRRSRSGSDTRREEEHHREIEPHCRDRHRCRDRRNTSRDRRRRSAESDRRRR